MDQKIQALLIEDLDSSEVEGTVRFRLDGTEYEFDLNAGHAQALWDALLPCACGRNGRGAVRGGQPGRSQGTGGRGIGTVPATGRWWR